MKTQNKRSVIADSIVETADVELTEAELVHVAGGLKIKLTQVYVTSYQLGASHGDD